MRITAVILAVALPAATALAALAPARAATPAAPAPPVFPGPLLGTPSTVPLTPAHFFYTCNVHASTDAVTASGAHLAPGSAIQDISGCGQAVLYLNAPAGGHFQARFAVADTATTPTSTLRLFLLASGGSLLRTLDVHATKGTAQRVDFDLAGGVALALTFPQPADSYVYAIKLTGTARALATTPLRGGGLPVGGAPVPNSALSYSCNAGVATDPGTVSGLAIAAKAWVQMEGCGKITVQIPANAHGALALRYGEVDASPYSGLPSQVALRVLDASGHLLRKAIGLTYLGSGLQPLWVNLQGGSTATFSIETASDGLELAAAGLSFLPSAVAPHHNPDREQFGSPSGAALPIPPDAVVGICNAGVGTSDTSVAHQPLLRDTYLRVEGCGIAELIMTNAHGRFSARIGVDDASVDSTITAHVVVLDQNSHPLTNSTVTAHRGQPGVPIDVSVNNASIVQISFSDRANGDLYDMQLSGHATLYDRVYPPSEPPVSTTGGAALDPRLMTVDCNVSVTTQDMKLIHQVALEQWSLYLNGCGSAILNLASLHGPHHVFSALYGIGLQDQQRAIGHVQLKVQDAKGKTLRQATFVARAGYGPRRAAISLAGGARLVITGADEAPLVLFALTTA